MATLNRVFLMGNLTRDPEVRYTPKGTAIAKLGMAVNRVYTTDSGEQKEEVTYVDVEVWGRQAETCKEYLSKGRPILIEGRLRMDSWEDKETHQKRSRMLVVADRVQFLGSPRRSEPGDAPANPEGRADEAAPRGAAETPGPSADAANDDNLPF
jgi:single-strand DNA-binding protein